MRRALLAPLFAVAFALASGGYAGELLPPPPGSDATEIARRAEDSMRSERTIIDAAMTVVSPRIATARVMRFQSWEERD
ncbi:MAG: hypothetical protein AAEJ53_03260, partial [Myxococcota bacterium]